MGSHILRDMHSGKDKVISVGDYSYGYEGIKIANSHDANLKIGKFCSLGWNISVLLGGQHRTRFNSTYPFGYLHQDKFSNFPDICTKQGKEFGTTKGDVIIGNDVWIGANVTILSGVNIGDGSVISANSVVYGKVKPYSIVGGNPAEFWWYRFDKEKIKILKEIKWWDWPEKHINAVLSDICSDNEASIINLKTYYDNHINT